VGQDEPADAGAAYSETELAALRSAVAAGRAPICPRDRSAMRRRAIGGGSFGLGYARRREWLLCPTCKRSAMFDVARGTRT
jgi:hypothetical protein